MNACKKSFVIEKIIMQLRGFYEKKARLWVTIIGFVMVGVIFYIDHLTDSEILSGVCYLAAVSYVTWFSGKLPGLLISVAGALSCFFNEYTGIDFVEHPIILYWNAGGMFGIFLVVTYILSEVKEVLGNRKKID